MKRTMTREKAIKYFKENFMPGLEYEYPGDKTAWRTAWNDFVDYLQKDGKITEDQAMTWDQPAFVK